MIPDLAPGTLINLRSGEWLHIHDLPGDVYCDVKVYKVHRGVPTKQELGHEWVWVTGHAPECSWASSDCTRPCVELWVRVDVLVRHAG